MMERDFDKALQEFGHQAKNVPSGPSSSRVWARLSNERKPHVRWAMVVAWAGAVLLLGVGAWVWRGKETTARSLAGFTVKASEASAAVENDGAVVVSRDCILSDEDVVLNASADTTIKRTVRGIELVRGRVTVSARHRRKDERPLRFHVSGGIVEVVGTRFTLVDDGTRGQLTMHEGVVRFIPHSGEITELRAGEAIDWPRERQTDSTAQEAVPVPVTETSNPLPSPARHKEQKTKALPQASNKKPLPIPESQVPEDVDEELEHIAQLRDRRQYEAAVLELGQVLRGVRDPSRRERLSFEIGSILTHQIGDRERACDHWRNHVNMFKAGRYAQEIQLLTQRLHCE